MNFPFATVGSIFRSPQCSLFQPQVTYPLRPPAGTKLQVTEGANVLGHTQALPAFLAQQSARSLWHTEPSFCLPTLPLFSRDERLPDSQAGHVRLGGGRLSIRLPQGRAEPSSAKKMVQSGLLPTRSLLLSNGHRESQMPPLRCKGSQAKFPSREDCEKFSYCFQVHPGPSL